MRWSNILSFFLAAIATFILLSIQWIGQTFGGVTYEQLVWHILNADTLQAFDPYYLVRGLVFLGILLALCLAIGLTIRYADRIVHKFLGCDSRTTDKGVLCLSVMFFLFAVIFFAIRYVRITEDVAYAGDFIADHYVLPQRLTFPEKKNLVIVLAESLENSFGAGSLKTSCIERLEKIRGDAAHTPHMVEVCGTGWTIAAATAWHFGLPLKTPHGIDGNNYVSRYGFLPHATSIFDILRGQGYASTLMMGSDSNFSGMKILFSGHGEFAIRDKQYFMAQGYDLERYQGLEWGYADAFILDRAVEEYARLKKQGKPFVLLIETVDTHFPEGFCPEERKTFFDIRDAIVELDRNLARFFQQLTRLDPGQEDVIIFLGDHYLMGNHEFMEPVARRSIYNMFHGALPALPEQKKTAAISALDIAPTLLQCAGARWENGRFGLGASLFSDEPSLVEQYGQARLDELLGKPSDKYSSFY